MKIPTPESLITKNFHCQQISGVIIVLIHNTVYVTAGIVIENTFNQNNLTDLTLWITLYYHQCNLKR